MTDSKNSFSQVATLPRVYPSPVARGFLRANYEDFYVEEELGFEPSGEGEHVFLFIEKRGLNTQQLAGQIARLANIPVKFVSYAGMKDRNAVTRQWFSVHLPKRPDINWAALTSNNVNLLSISRHSKKLRRGVHKKNRFVIRITNVEATGTETIVSELEQRAKLVSDCGVPNYYGEQRFGRGQGNLLAAQEMFEGALKPKRHLRGIYLSAARSFLFNQVLAARIDQGNWDQAIDGELVMLDGTNSFFPAREAPDVADRVAAGDVHPTGMLVGSEKGMTADGDVANLENRVIENYPVFIDGLMRARMKSERRALRVIPEGFSIEINGSTLTVSFALPRGCFATSVLRELVDYELSANSEDRS